MNGTLIVSERGFKVWVSRQLVFEWEDEMLKAIEGSRLFLEKDFEVNGHRLLGSLARRTGINFYSLQLRGRNAFRFSMSPDLNHNPWNLPEISTNIIDFYLTKDSLKRFYANYDKVDRLYVSSREVFEFLMDNHPEREVRHLPLTLPDKYRITKDTQFDKKYDIVMLGRQSPTLRGYLEEYSTKHALYYVQNTGRKGENLKYLTNRGEVIPDIVTREDYMNLLRKSRMALYGTSGIDGERPTNGFHQVTPKFLEDIACGCHVISRYVDNPDTDFFELGRMSMRVNNFQQFEEAMEYALHEPVDMQKYAEYLQNHYTSTYRYLM